MKLHVDQSHLLLPVFTINNMCTIIGIDITRKYIQATTNNTMSYTHLLSAYYCLLLF